MNDIIDIKPLLLWFPIDFFNTLILLIFIFILGLLIRIFLYKEKNVIKEEKEEENMFFEEKKDYKKILMDFQNEFLNSKSEVFYSKLIEIFKLIIKDKDWKDISKMTYEEITWLNIDEKLINIIKEIYFKEYIKEIYQDTEDYRKELVSKILEIYEKWVSYKL